MDVILSGKDGRAISKTQEKKAEPLILNITDGDAHIQVEIKERSLWISGDGGTARRGTWDVELFIPRVNERKVADA